MPTEITPMSALILIAVGVLFGLGLHLAGVVIEAIKNGTASTGAVICIILAVILVIVAIVV